MQEKGNGRALCAYISLPVYVGSQGTTTITETVSYLARNVKRCIACLLEIGWTICDNGVWPRRTLTGEAYKHSLQNCTLGFESHQA